jgi:TPR repeat protein
MTRPALVYALAMLALCRPLAALAETVGAPAATLAPASSPPGRAAPAVPPPALAEGLRALDDKRYAVALKLFNDAFAAGNADGGFYLARMVELGVGVEAAPQKARILYLAAADKGSAKAMNRVGLMHFRGEDVLQDYDAAREMICKAADLGDADGAFNCAGLYADGRGVAKDAAKAFAYYRKAAEQRHIGAEVALGFAYLQGSGTDKDPAGAKAAFEAAASRGNPVALFQLGAMYETGAPVARDLTMAHLYYNLASARQYSAANEALQRVTAAMDPQAVEAAQTKAKQWKAVP